MECIILRVASARFSRSTRFCRMVAGYFRVAFPFLFGGTFIEGVQAGGHHGVRGVFPSFSEGLSLRVAEERYYAARGEEFPFLFGGTFIEGSPPRYR